MPSTIHALPTQMDGADYMQQNPSVSNSGAFFNSIIASCGWAALHVYLFRFSQEVLMYLH